MESALRLWKFRCSRCTTHDPGVRRFPAFRLQLSTDLVEHLLILRVRHLLIDPEIVARLVIRRDLEILGVPRPIGERLANLSKTDVQVKGSRIPHESHIAALELGILRWIHPIHIDVQLLLELLQPCLAFLLPNATHCSG